MTPKSDGTICIKVTFTFYMHHDLRHTAASYMVMAGVPLKTVGEILGHKTTAMTERYAHLAPEHKKRAVEMLPNWEQGEHADNREMDDGSTSERVGALDPARISLEIH